MKISWRVVGISIGAIAVVPLLLVIIFIVGSLPGSTKQLEAVAEQFKPDPSWTFVNKNIKPPRSLCLEGSCDSASYEWNTKNSVNSDELIKLAKQSDISLNYSSSCVGEDKSTCSLHGVKSNYYFDFYIELSSDNSSYNKVKLFVDRQ